VHLLLEGKLGTTQDKALTQKTSAGSGFTQEGAVLLHQAGNEADMVME